ncbi:Hypothetical protein I595_9 [Croceitalea dokdonensis DOKDO 023]|uniref:2TM domain-containing protein n=1 Tax=Croceitalea dokdonensis DOKDO 023 TaxID=1300341 RepID=A0A0P7AY22_9FLAO|nr:2TM domain-containing protein [Croceitalea dokdonensis]KPM33107.1 Hypothetical protein I595_9 [Croceitalea dokdonensis DOKDO 023]
MEKNNTDTKYLKARERVDQLRKFYVNLTSYVLVIAGLAGLNYWIDEWRYPWFLWAALGWGIGVFFHALGTFNLNPFFGKKWEERKIKEYMEKEQTNTKWK